jgi:hypothetical protein
MLLWGALGLTLVGCSGNSFGGSNKDEGESKLGQLALPLVTQGASGLTYHLRDATFAIHRPAYDYSYGTAGTASMYVAGSGGSGGGEEVITVSSETNPSAQNISVSLEEGNYYVELLPGWHFEKDGPMGAETVEATLLSGQTQWVWVSRQSTSFAEFQFGLGGREVWLNGQLNIDIVLHEDPSELQGSSGSATGGYYGYGGTGTYSAGTGPVPAAGGTGAN